MHFFFLTLNLMDVLSREYWYTKKVEVLFSKDKILS
jgi:hypothetical protein